MPNMATLEMFWFKQKLFAILSKSKDPYMCSFCSLSKYKEEITGLRNQITSLTNELASLKCNRECMDAFDQTSSNNQNLWMLM